MSRDFGRYHSDGVRHVIFGDLYLEGIRRYREEELARSGMSCVFPLWQKGTKKLALSFVKQGFRAVVCAINPKMLDASFCGREFDEKFLDDLPTSVDPCGENGEFHTFAYAGPIFDREIVVQKRDIVMKEGFYFADLLPA